MSTNPKDKLAAKKVSPGLVSPFSIVETALAMQDGARKYGPYNWRENPISMTVYLNATFRHLLLLMAGQDQTSDTNVPHRGAISANMAIIGDAEAAGVLIDDRHKNAEVIKKIEELLELAK